MGNLSDICRDKGENLMSNINSGNTVNNSGIVFGGIKQSQGPIAFIPPEQVPSRTKNTESTFSYDVAISYASEQEKIVSRVASILRVDGFRVFFAPDQESEYIAEDMIAQFYRIYRYESRYVAAFVTEDYLHKDITMHEAKTAMLRRQEEGRNCLIPIYFEKAVLPHLGPDIHYIRGDGLREVELADKIRSVLLAQNR